MHYLHYCKKKKKGSKFKVTENNKGKKSSSLRESQVDNNTWEIKHLVCLQSCFHLLGKKNKNKIDKIRLNISKARCQTLKSF